MTTRFVRAPREQVFDAFLAAEALRHWHRPRAMKVTDAMSQAEVGGRYRVEIESPVANLDSLECIQHRGLNRLLHSLKRRRQFAGEARRPVGSRLLAWGKDVSWLLDRASGILRGKVFPAAYSMCLPR